MPASAPGVIDELRQILVGNVDPWRIELQEAHQLQATQFQFRTFGGMRHNGRLEFVAEVMRFKTGDVIAIDDPTKCLGVEEVTNTRAMNGGELIVESQA